MIWLANPLNLYTQQFYNFLNRKPMSFNLMDLAKGYFSNQLVSKASSFLGESESGVAKAVSAVLPSIIGGVADKASSLDGAATISRLATEQHNGGILNSIGDFLSPEKGNDLLGKSTGIISSIFGNSGGSNMLTNLISNFAGVKGSTVGTLISMAAPAVLGMIGKHKSETNLSDSGLASMLGEQKKLAMSALPSGFSLPGVSGAASAAASHATGAATAAAGAATASAGGVGRFILPAVLLGGLAFGAYYLFNKKGKDAGHTEATTATTTATGGSEASTTATMPAVEAPKVTVDATTGLVSYDLGALGDIDLPGGAKLTGVAANGFENTLVNFIKNGTIDTADKKANWFNLHDVQFVSGKTVYATEKASAQIKNVGAILKAYPNVKIKLGGYTDASGDAAANLKLSQARAEQVVKDLNANGAAAGQVVEGVGYGSQFAEAAAGDKEGMAKDRKVAAKVASK
jgi:OmpA-OmpF porin, OOP family